jgi:acyl-CoA thioesterase YciA
MSDSDKDNSTTLPASEPSLRAIAMPADTNPNGDIFGGWLLSQMDLAGSTAAQRRAGGRVVTVAITSMVFRQPVFVGDEVSCYAKVGRIGHTSLAVMVESWVRRGTGHEAIKVTEGLFTYVAIDANRRPLQIQPDAHGEDQTTA